MTVFEQNKMERDSYNLERIADSLECIEATMRKLVETINKINKSEDDKEN